MAVLATLKKDRLGEWTTLADYLADLRRRETNSVAALAGALSAAPDEQRELGQGDGLRILVEVASDLRLPKGSRLAAARCALEAGASGQLLGALFLGAGDLATDPRMGAAAKKLVDAGLASALAAGAGQGVSMEAGAFARAAQAGASAVGQARIRELLGTAPQGHAGAAAALFALGAAELPEPQRQAWAKLLAQTCAANRSAPAAAKRLGLAPPWPPGLPEAFAALVQEAEKASAGVVAADAAAPLKAPSRGPAPPPARPPAATTHRAAKLPAPKGPVEMGKKTVAPIKPSPFRRAIGTVVEGPVKLPPKPMPPVTSRVQADQGPQRPSVPPSPRGPSGVSAPLPGIMPLVRRDTEELRFDARGRRIPRPDRWSESNFGWETPVLPSPEAPPVRKALPAAGPFARRLEALFDDRPEAVERLCAAVEARGAVHGLPAALEELSLELSQKRWKDRRAPPGQLQRLASVSGGTQPEPWTAAALLLLRALRIED